MQTQATNPVATIQELMAAHATRADGYENLQSNTADTTLKSNLAEKASASRRCNEELLKELSQFGDAAQSEVNRDNELQRAWTEITIGAENDPQKLPEMTRKADSALVELYDSFLKNAAGLPETLCTLLERQKTLLVAAKP